MAGGYVNQYTQVGMAGGGGPVEGIEKVVFSQGKRSSRTGSGVGVRRRQSGEINVR